MFSQSILRIAGRPYPQSFPFVNPNLLETCRNLGAHSL
jgi:hypothetical protein